MEKDVQEVKEGDAKENPIAEEEREGKWAIELEEEAKRKGSQL